MNQTKFFYLQSGISGCAVFEIDEKAQTAIVSAILGYATMMYKNQMSIEKAREEYKKMLDKGKIAITEEEARKRGFSHRYVWNFYR